MVRDSQRANVLNYIMVIIATLLYIDCLFSKMIMVIHVSGKVVDVKRALMMLMCSFQYLHGFFFSQCLVAVNSQNGFYWLI